MLNSCTPQAKYYCRQPHHFISQAHLAGATSGPRRHTDSSIHSSPGGEGERKWSEPPHAQ